MCGIAGVFRIDGGPASREDAARMVAAMPHRGPDGRGAWSDGPVALGHVRLAVRDLSPRSAQPLLAPGGEGALVYNGEVYETGAIRAELAREGVACAGTGDAEVVLHALSRWGVERAVRRFDGMFAFAWWDARERALWLVRDRFGIKPLHVARTAERVAFASELRGLRALEGVATRPDRLELARRVMPGLVDEIRPPFEGVENVLPGEAWRCTSAGVERRTWWSFASDLDVGRIVSGARDGPDAWETRTREALEAAVLSHLESDVPVAAFTSGGVDSNLVAAIARDHRPDLVAFTIDTCDPSSETPAAAAMARHAGFELRPVRFDRAAHLAAWPEAVEAIEHPFTHPSQVASLVLARAARTAGFTVVLTGEGADELFGGYDFLRRTRVHWRESRRPWRRLTRAGRTAARDLEDVPFRYQSVRHERDTHLRFAAALGPVEESRPHALLALLAPVEPVEDRAFLAHSFDALHRHLGWILLRHDRVGMAASLEARVPFLSSRVAEVGLHLPVCAKVRRGVGKWCLKRVAARRLPPALVYAPKKGFDVPEAQHRGTSALLRGGAVPELFRWTRAAEDDLVPRIERDPTLRHQMVSLELWARIFLHGERAADLAGLLSSVAGGGVPGPEGHGSAAGAGRPS